MCSNGMILRFTAILPPRSAVISSRTKMRSPSSRRVRARISHAAHRRRGGRPHRRSVRAARGAHLLGRRHGDPDLPDRASAGIRDARLAGADRADFLRMVQGLSVGGEYTSSMVFLVEHAPDGRRGLMGALAASGAGGGTLLGSAVGAGFAASMSDATLEAWGWRIPFLLGLVVGIGVYLLRRHVLDTVPAERRQRAPIVETLHDHWRIVLGFAGLSVFNAVGFYVGFVYLVSWLQTADGIAPARALEINSLSMAVLLPVVIATGFLTDRIGRKPV